MRVQRAWASLGHFNFYHFIRLQRCCSTRDAVVSTETISTSACCGVTVDGTRRLPQLPCPVLLRRVALLTCGETTPNSTQRARRRAQRHAMGVCCCRLSVPLPRLLTGTVLPLPPAGSYVPRLLTESHLPLPPAGSYVPRLLTESRLPLPPVGYLGRTSPLSFHPPGYSLPPLPWLRTPELPSELQLPLLPSPPPPSLPPPLPRPFAPPPVAWRVPLRRPSYPPMILEEGRADGPASRARRSHPPEEPTSLRPRAAVPRQRSGALR